MNPGKIYLLIACITATGCRIDGQGQGSGLIRIYPSDEEVLAAAYDPTYDVPEGFFVDDRANTEGSYTIHHVKDASLSYELCSDDIDGATAVEDKPRLTPNACDNLASSIPAASATFRIRQHRIFPECSSVPMLTVTVWTEIFELATPEH